MIKALIQNGDDRVLLLNFPSTRMRLAGSLTYVDPATGGENHFIGGSDNGVTEIPAEDLIGDDNPKPGEGIHF